MSVLEDTLASVLEWGSSVGTDPCVELGDTHVAFEECVLGTQSSGTSAPTLQRAGEGCSPASATQPQHRRSLSKHEQVSLLLLLFGRDELWSPLPRVMVLSASVSAQHTGHGWQGEPELL